MSDDPEQCSPSPSSVKKLGLEFIEDHIGATLSFFLGGNNLADKQINVLKRNN